MAQTKTRGSKKSSPASTRSRSRSSANSRSSASRKPRPSSKSKSKSKRTSAAKASPSPASQLRDAPQAVEKAGRKLGRDVGRTVSKARTPLLAGGAALAGAAGGLAIGAMRSRRAHGALVPKALQGMHVSISSQDVARAARGIGQVSQHVADLTSEMNGNGHQRNGRHRSPVEVVLEGLTTRH